MDQRLPLSALLSHALVAFTIEFDNEFEHRMPHRTSEHSGSDHGTSGLVRAPWLVSMAMWSNCLRVLDDSGTRVHEVESLALAKSNFEGLRRWGYIQLTPDRSDPRSKPPIGDLVVR